MAKTISHSERAHALLSASGAYRWLNCTPSAKMEEKYGRDEQSVFAAEGTLAHELAEIRLRFLMGLIDKKKHDHLVDVEINKNSDLFSNDMPDYVEMYTAYVMEQYSEAKAKVPYTELLIEQKVDLREYIKDSFGTCDSIIMSNGVMEVIDLKYGKGVSVDATNNPQLMLYALGAYHELENLYDIKTIRLTIHQPRLDNVSSWEITVEELVKWAEDEVKPKAKLATAGKGDCKAGTWCKFCKVKASCKALSAYCQEPIKESVDPKLLSDEDIIAILDREKIISEWLEAIKKFVLENALEGKEYAGYKLVEGRSVRVISDEDMVVKVLSELGFSDEEIFNSKIKGIGELEKALGKERFKKELGEYITKPQGKPSLVISSDKRDTYVLNNAKEDFA